MEHKGARKPAHWRVLGRWIDSDGEDRLESLSHEAAAPAQAGQMD